MAFGRYPDRTIIVAVGPTTRPFSDIAGRHVIHLSNEAEARHALADRLRTSGCDVRTNNRKDWLRTGNFDVATHEPDFAAMPEMPSVALPNNPQASSKGTTAKELTVQKKPFDFDPECKKMTFRWEEGLSIQIDWYNRNTYGFLLCISNDTPVYIASYKVQVIDATSWSEAHQTFRPNRSFNTRAISSGKDIGPSERANHQPLIRVLSQKDDWT